MGLLLQHRCGATASPLCWGRTGLGVHTTKPAALSKSVGYYGTKEFHILPMSLSCRGRSSFFPRGGGFDPTTMRSIVHEPRSGEPIFCVLFWTPVSDVFLASTKGGGGFKPYCLRLSLRQSAIGTYCVGLDILWWRFSMHIKFLIFTWQPKGGV